MLALSTSSPFWDNRDTGLMSYRTLIVENLPRSNIAPYFSTMAEFIHYQEVLQKTHSITDGKEVWWDIRPHYIFPTIECRICDHPTSSKDIIALAALFQALVVKSHKLLLNGYSVKREHHLFHQENKWRASRYGLEGSFIDCDNETEIPVTKAIEKMLEFIADEISELGSSQAIEHIHTILKRNTSAVMQIECYKQDKNFNQVIKHILKRQET